MPIETEKAGDPTSRRIVSPCGGDAMKTTAKEELLQTFDRLAEDKKKQVLEFIRQIAAPSSDDRPWMKLVGILDSKSAEQMRAAIEEDCEQIHDGEW